MSQQSQKSGDCPASSTQKDSEVSQKASVDSQTSSYESSGSRTSGSQTTSSGGGTGSSGDTVPASTQEVTENPDAEPTELKPPAWGVLYPKQNEFYPLDLVDERYTFGRSNECDYNLDNPRIKTTKFFRNYSKMHFAIQRSIQNDKTYQSYIEDLGGTNGTFVNGEKIPSKRSRPLKTADNISLAYHDNNIFVYFDMTSQTESGLPKEFSSKYILNHLLGKGAFGEVYEVWFMEDCQRYAAKILDKQRMSLYAGTRAPGGRVRDLMDEVKILQHLKHPCIIGMRDVIDTPDNLYIILEYAGGGELFDRVKHGRLPEPLAKLYFYQMLSAVAYLHSNGITHRDLKPENVLLMSNEEPCLLKITDFGYSRLLQDEALMSTIAGTKTYLAPEIVQYLHTHTGSSPTGYTNLVDIWSLGVILYVCLAGYPPFADNRIGTSQTLEKQILSGNVIFYSSPWKTISDDAKDLVKHLMKVDTKTRLTSAQAMVHNWLDDAQMKEAASRLMVEENKFTTSIELLAERSLSGTSDSTRKISTDDDGNSRISHVEDVDDSERKPLKRHAEKENKSASEGAQETSCEPVLEKQPRHT
ncbi:serine/threonine-protein kinase Chk2-like [Clavelina lepadiformis]|uniref:Serine/threonine-protein kinase Chk2 n=1 Tax=Clavelina lepadiformis TaxID=159417 RepID=A0ABP0FZI3_CLALP